MGFHEHAIFTIKKNDSRFFQTMSKRQQIMTKIENNDDFSMRNPNFIADFPENAIFTIFQFSKNRFRHISPTKTVHNQVRPPETNVGRQHGRGATQNLVWPKMTSHSTDFRFDRCVFFPGGMPDTIRGSKMCF